MGKRFKTKKIGDSYKMKKNFEYKFTKGIEILITEELKLVASKYDKSRGQVINKLNYIMTEALMKISKLGPDYKNTAKVIFIIMPRILDNYKNFNRLIRSLDLIIGSFNKIISGDLNMETMKQYMDKIVSIYDEPEVLESVKEEVVKKEERNKDE